MQYTTNLSFDGPFYSDQHSWVESIGISHAFAQEVIRDILQDQHEQLNEQHLDWILEAIHAQMNPEELLSFAEFLKSLGKSGRSLKKFGKKALPVVGQVAQIAAPIVGAAIGGPAGAQIGGMVSQGIGTFMNKDQGAAKMPAAQQLAGNTQLLSPAQPAARQVLGLIQNPSFIQSLLGQLLGGSQGGNVAMRTTGKAQSSQIPFAAFMNLLGQLSTQAVVEANGSTTTKPSYLEDDNGNLLVEAASAAERAELLLDLLYDNTFDNYLPESIENTDDLSEWLIAAGLMR